MNDNYAGCRGEDEMPPAPGPEQRLSTGDAAAFLAAPAPGKVELAE